MNDGLFNQIANLRRLELSAKLKHFPAIVCFSASIVHL